MKSNKGIWCLLSQRTSNQEHWLWENPYTDFMLIHMVMISTHVLIEGCGYWWRCLILDELRKYNAYRRMIFSLLHPFCSLIHWILTLTRRPHVSSCWIAPKKMSSLSHAKLCTNLLRKVYKWGFSAPISCFRLTWKGKISILWTIHTIKNSEYRI